MVVNLQGDATSKYIYYLTNRVSFPVYQDTTSLNIWSTLDGRKDDILVYDRCGQLTYHVRMPDSYLKKDFVEEAIKKTSLGYDPCRCTPSTPVAMTTFPATELLMTTFPTTEALTTVLYENDLPDDIEEEEEAEMENEEMAAEQDNEEGVEQGNEEDAKAGNY